MSQLIYRSPYTLVKDEVVIAFEGTASETLAAALDYLNQSALERARLLVSGEVECVPEVIMDNCKKLLEGDRKFAYTITTHADYTYSIWISDGPDRFDLVN